jgi:hypothetical protein
MKRLFAKPLRLLSSYHLLGSLLIVVIATAVIADQVEHREDFANSELSVAVESRWGAPVSQPAPSLRYVESGSIFTSLEVLSFEAQHMNVEAQMNYRKRGLRYFSGFDFVFDGKYAAQNPEAHDIDVAFVFPITVDKSQVLLSELEFTVNGEPAALDLGDAGNRLMWTGRIQKGGRAAFNIRYRARGLDSFIYRLDPSLPARDVALKIAVTGGDNFDYPANVLSANSVTQTKDQLALDWRFASLQSGVALGVILPSQESYDSLIATMARRAWCPFLVFAVLLCVLAIKHQRPLLFYEAYLVAALYGFVLVLLAYLAAFMNFYVAYVLSVTLLGAVFVGYGRALFPHESPRLLAGLWFASAVVPTVAVIAQGYTGLIYTLEIFTALLGAMALSTRPAIRALIADLSTKEEGVV